MTLYHFFKMCLGNNVPDPSDSDSKMEASGTSEVPSQGELHVLNSVYFTNSRIILLRFNAFTREK